MNKNFGNIFSLFRNYVSGIQFHTHNKNNESEVSKSMRKLQLHIGLVFAVKL